MQKPPNAFIVRMKCRKMIFPLVCSSLKTNNTTITVRELSDCTSYRVENFFMVFATYTLVYVWTCKIYFKLCLPYMVKDAAVLVSDLHRTHFRSTLPERPACNLNLFLLIGLKGCQAVAKLVARHRADLMTPRRQKQLLYFGRFNKYLQSCYCKSMLLFSIG